MCFVDNSQAQLFYTSPQKDVRCNLIINVGVGSSLTWFFVPVHWHTLSHLTGIHLCFLILWLVLQHYDRTYLMVFCWGLNEIRHLKCQRQSNVQWLLLLLTIKMVIMMVTRQGVVYGYGDVSPLSSLPFPAKLRIRYWNEAYYFNQLM